ncbi:hypothetical protein HELRODRAFT_90454 [Helobdella robusta]|uniref:Galactosyltransferase C-terminal domain-containing protein n=1 Tax=Helobdella robusta TaxID=6412 RepID=T1G7R6_HELRO|nr:hypothetical protein HELRODRAFT_90454 [Helobdella robusta]ESN91114.1 hypothetical protein HELRODRAFT_90454 [Helobdella robusta]
MLLVGGEWKPPCRSWQKLAIVVPYRDRYHHLLQLLDRLHAMLKKQLVHYKIFVVEQLGEGKFNRGRLLNVGVVEALKDQPFDCFVFHDVDLLPEDDRNIYHCNENVHHPISALDEMRYHIMYYNYLGGVLTINRDNVFKANGHSNDYWGWGNEDDDFNARLSSTMEIGLMLTRPPENIGRFKMVRHAKLWRESHG